MNDTKWLELQQGIGTLLFPPAYNEKLVQWDKAQFTFKDFEKPPSYLGNWSSFFRKKAYLYFLLLSGWR